MVSSRHSDDDVAEKENTNSNAFELKKRIGLGSGVAIISGTMIGSGIFVSPVGILENTNNSVGLSLVLWLACGIVSLLAGLCYAELGTLIKRSGSDYAYLDRCYGEAIAFMYVWSDLLILRGSGNAAKAIIFGEYLVSPFYRGDCSPPVSAVKCSGAVLLITCCAVNYITVKGAAKFQIVFTIAKFLGMGIIIVAGFAHLFGGDPVAQDNFNNMFDSDQLSTITAGQIALAFYQGLWAYDGYTNLNYIVEEIKNLPRNLPWSVIISVVLVTTFYLLVNVAYLSVLTPNEMTASKSVAVTFGYAALGNWAWLMPLTVCLSIIGSTNGSMMTGGRLSYVASRRGHWPDIFAMVHSDYFTPAPSMIWDTTVALLFLIPGDFDTLLSAFSFTSWTFRGMSCAGLIWLRYKEPNAERPYKVNLSIPIIVVLMAIFLVVAPVISDPTLLYLYAILFILASLLVYFPVIRYNIVMPGMNYFTTYAQLAFDVAPSEVKAD